MQVLTSIISDHLGTGRDAAIEAEARGYDGLTAQENNHDPLLPLAVAAVSTGRVRLITSIVVAFPRSPTTVAHAAHDIHVASGGRLTLGLGTQVKGHNERRFGVPWSAPAPRMAEYVQALRAIWRCWETGEPLAFEGEHYRLSLMPPNFRPPACGLPPIPVTVAAVGAAMMRLAGRHCDGVALHPFCTRAYAENVALPEIGKGLERAGRDRASFEIGGGGFIATGPDDETVARRLEHVRQRVAFYGSTRTYLPVFAEHGLEDLGHELHGMSRRGQWDEMPGRVSDDVVRLFAAVGRHDEIVSAIEARFAGVADAVSDPHIRGDGPAMPPDLIADIRAIPVPFNGFPGRERAP